MKKSSEIRFLNDALLIDSKILVFGDVHIGYEEHIVTNGSLPDVQLKEILEKLNEIFSLLEKEKIKIEKIIILGDLKHELGLISAREWRETLELLDFLIEKLNGNVGNNKKGIKNVGRLSKNVGSIGDKKRYTEIILIKGNHDNILGPIAKKREVRLVNYYKYKEICFFHGNKLWKECLKSDKFIVGHLHPAISLSDKYKREKFKCFLKGKWKKKEVYVLPSFSPISFGYDLSLEKMQADGDGFLFIHDDKLKDFNVIIYNNKEHKEYYFGKLGKII